MSTREPSANGTATTPSAPPAAIGYIRVSGEAQAEKGYSLPDQRKMITEYAERQGLRLVEIIADEGVSGKLSDRPGLGRLLQLADARAYDVFVAVKIDRLGRGNRIIQNALHDLRRRGIDIRFSEHASGDRPADRLLLNVLGGVAEFEWDQIRERTMVGRYAKARDGKMPSALRLYGYEVVSKAQAAVLPEFQGMDGSLVINAEEAAVVREVYRRYAGGQGIHGLAVWLNEAGIKTKRRNLWDRMALHRLLTNSAYIGRQYYGRRSWKLCEGEAQRLRTSEDRPEEEWVCIPCPPIVDETLFYAVQERFRANREAIVGRPSNTFLLSRIVECGNCAGKDGHPLKCHGRRASGTKTAPGYNRFKYACNSLSQPQRGFCGTWFPAPELEEMAWDAAETILQPGVLAAYCRSVIEAELANAGGAAEEIDGLERSLAKLEGEERALLDAAIAGHFSAHLIQERTSELQRRRADVRARLETAKARAATTTQPARVVERADALAAEYRMQLAALKDDRARLQRFYQRLLRITITGRDQEPEIRVWLGDLLPGREARHK
jgi:site-specific DNA recombinase